MSDLADKEAYYENQTSTLRNMLTSGNIITIAGAGVSLAATEGEPVAGWDGLLRHGVEYCLANARETNEKWKTRQIDALNEGTVEEIVSVAKHIEDQLGGTSDGRFYHWLKETVGSLRVSDERLPLALASLPTMLLTTNYDEILETVSNMPSFTWASIHRAENFFRRNEDGVFHLHGLWREPEQVVLGVNYVNLLGDEQRQALLKSLLLEHRFLFVGLGSGISDPHFRALMDWSRRIYGQSDYRHYLLTRRQDLEAVEGYIGDHVVALPYGDDYCDLPAFVQSLVPTPVSPRGQRVVQRQEYQLVIDCDVTTAVQISQLDLEATLRQLTSDYSLVLRRAEIGSLRLLILSTEKAKKKLNAMLLDDRLREHLVDLAMQRFSLLASSLDQQIKEGFRSPSNGLLNWPKTLHSGEWLDRPEIAQILDALNSEDTSSTVLLGGPGLGKSALLSRLAEAAKDEGFLVIGCKADYLPENITSVNELQRLWQLPLSVDESIRYLCRKQKTLFLIDQLDALADLVDVNTGRLNALLELINGLTGEPNLHIVTSSRLFEYQHDVRLSTIDASELLLRPPTWEQVGGVLSLHGVEAEHWPETFREILRVPQHLKVMLAHFCEADEPATFSSYHQMLEALWKKSVLPWQKRGELVDQIASDMAKDETLWVVKARYDSQFLQEIDDLIGEDVLKVDRGSTRLGFSHQTLFSFARARAFAKGAQELSEYVDAGQDSLFIRPTLWNALFYLRSADTKEYMRQFITLWNSSSLRKHVRFLLVDFLGRVSEPLDCEVKAVVDFLGRGLLVSRILKSLGGNKNWFLELSGMLPKLMTMPSNNTWPLANFLKAAIPFAYNRIHELVRAHWLPNPARDPAVWQIFESPSDHWTNDSQEVILEIMGRTDVEQVQVTKLVKDVACLSPTAALRIARCQLDKELAHARTIDSRLSRLIADEVAGDEGTMQLSSKQELERLGELLKKSNDWHELSDIAKKHPAEFLRELWTWFARLVDLIDHDARLRIVSYSRSWSLSTVLNYDEHLSIVYQIPYAYDVAVQEFAKSDVDSFLTFVGDNAKCDSMLLQRMLARGLRNVVETHSSDCLKYLLEDRRRLVLGDYQDIHKDSTALIHAMVPCLAPEQRKEIEEFILNFDLKQGFEGDTASEKRDSARFNREHRLRLLNAIPEKLVSDETAAIVRSERTALVHYRDWDTFSSGMMRIDSPMSADQMMKAKNEDIVGLFEVLRDNTGWDHPVRARQGGTIQASREFSQFARHDPDRAISVIAELTPGEHETPVGHALVALAESHFPAKELYDLVADLCERGFQTEAFREEAARAIRTTMREDQYLPDDVCELLEKWVGESWRRPVDVEESRSLDEPETADLGSVLWATGGFELLPHGSYHALDTLTYEYTRRQPPLTEKWMHLLEVHLERGDRAEVWRTLMHWFDNLRLCDQPRVTTFLHRLFDLYPSVLCSRNGAVFLAHARSWLDEKSIQHWLEVLRDSNWKLGPQAFGELEFLCNGSLTVSSRPGYLEYLGSEHLSTQLIGIRKGLAHAAAYLWTDPKYRSSSTEVMIRLMSSSESSVLAAVLDVFRVTHELPMDEYTVNLLDGMCTNDVFGHMSHTRFFLDRLVTLVRHERGLVARVVEGFIEQVASGLTDLGSAFAGAAPQLTDIALTLQRYDETREDGTRLFERLLELDAYGAQAALNELDQIPGRSFVRQHQRNRPHGPRRRRTFE